MSEHPTIALRGEKVLKCRAEEVEKSDEPLIKALVKDMLIAMRLHGGVGIAAPQIKISKRVIIIQSSPNDRYPDAPQMQPLIMINPEILYLSEEKEKMWEGCLSVPGLRGLVARHITVRVRFYSLNNQVQEIELSNFPARIFQHEYDHLEGILFPERVENSSDIYSEAEYRRRVLTQ